jgi:N-acetylneuraminic acid mutarotase
MKKALIVRVILLVVVLLSMNNLFASNCQYNLLGDLNEDCQIDFADFALMAAGWLVDCNDSPLNPACRCDIPWIAEPPMNAARDQFAGGVIDSNIYVFGGNGNPDGVDLKSTEVYNPAITDPNINPWTILADNPHIIGSGVEELTSAVVDNKLYVFGADKIIFNEMYDPVTNTWTTLAPKPTFTRAGPATVYNDEIYIFGGSSNDPNLYNEDSNIVECYDPNSNTWRHVTNIPLLMSNFAIATIGSKAYLLGGAVGSQPPDIQLLDDVITYDFDANSWDTASYQPVPVKKAFMYSNSAPIIDGKIYLIGGWKIVQDGFVLDNRVDIYDPAANTWEEGTPLPLPLGDYVTLAIGPKIYVLGGCNTLLGWNYPNRSKVEVISYDTDHCSN